MACTLAYVIFFEFVYFEGTDTASRPTSKVRSHVRAHPQVFCYKNTSKLNFYFKILVYVKLLLYLCSRKGLDSNMTTLTHSEKEAIMKDMKSFDEPMPAVGIFWYDPEEHDFFGVYKKELTPKMVEDAADKGLPYINYQTLHRQVWQKQYFKALAKHEPTKFSGDYTQVPRGRVAWAVDHFVVFVGQWAKDIEEELTALLEKYFALPSYEFKYDDHWDLCPGSSADL